MAKKPQSDRVTPVAIAPTAPRRTSSPYTPQTASGLGITEDGDEGNTVNRAPANYDQITALSDDESWRLYRAGIVGGAGLTDYGTQLTGQGASMLGQAADLARSDRSAGYGMAAMGASTAASGLQGQDAQLNALISNAQRVTPSVAQAQLRMAQDAQARQMMAQAATARGGNQAAAMRNAQDQASQNALVTNQQAAVLRAQEEQARQQNILGARQYAAGAYGDRARLGYGVQESGLGLGGAATGRVAAAGAAIGGLGTDTANIGVHMQDVYVNPTAAFDRDAAQRELEDKRRKEEARMAEIRAGSEIAKGGGVAILSSGLGG